MRYGIVISLSNVHDLVDAACDAEAAGWDAVFVADAPSCACSPAGTPSLSPTR